MFGPENRLSKAEIFKQNILFGEFTENYLLLDAILDFVLILNSQRQIIFINETMRDFLGAADRSSVYGLRPGEILNCTHAFELATGCGTSKFCEECGAAKALKSSLSGNRSIEECRITTVNNESLDLKVSAVPVEYENEKFTIFTLTDISNEKRRMMLERVFFHDILNTAGGIKGISDILTDTENDENAHMHDLLTQLSDRLIDEIKAQQELTLAEHGELQTLTEKLSTESIIEKIVGHYKIHPAADKKEIQIISTANYALVTDKRLLLRVIGNMLKNALEATLPGETVQIFAKKKARYIIFLVHNNAFIERSGQLQIFQRSFSTKGINRGLGTYSIKLLTEKFLNGKAGFTSSKEKGTTFYVIYPEK